MVETILHVVQHTPNAESHDPEIITSQQLALAQDSFPNAYSKFSKGYSHHTTFHQPIASTLSSLSYRLSQNMFA